jgi:hypothetical protein
MVKENFLEKWECSVILPVRSITLHYNWLNRFTSWQDRSDSYPIVSVKIHKLSRPDILTSCQDRTGLILSEEIASHLDRTDLYPTWTNTVWTEDIYMWSGQIKFTVSPEKKNMT